LLDTERERKKEKWVGEKDREIGRRGERGERER